MRKKDKKTLDTLSSMMKGVTAPDSISEQNIDRMVASDKRIVLAPDQTKKTQSVGKTIGTVVAIVACFAIFVTTGSVGLVAVADSRPPVVSAFSDYDQIDRAMKRATRRQSIRGLIGSGFNLLQYKGSDEQLTEDATVNESGNGSGVICSEPDYSTTYTQVNLVNEADIIQNNGKYIFWADTTENVIYVYEGANKVASISNIGKKSDNIVHYTTDMFLYGDRLVVNTNNEEVVNIRGENGTVSTIKDMSHTYIYDVSDVHNIELVGAFSQSGCPISTRMIGSMLYVVTNDYNRYDSDNNYKKRLPCVGDDGNDIQPLDCNKICRPQRLNDDGFIVISAINVENNAKTSSTKALFGTGGDLYCNENNMYIYYEEYDRFFRPNTHIIRVELGDEIRFAATGKIHGYTNNQFSLDEKDGYLRIATTSYGKDDKTRNNLFVMNENLEKVSEIKDLAPSESIQSVRFVGDMAYVITYEYVDPLFVIDLSDPKSPKVCGSVEISGFSSQLVPIDDSTIVGIGYSSEFDEEYQFSYINGLKIALFDVSDPKNPRVLDSYTMPDYDSDAQINHHAITRNAKDGYIAIPIYRYDYDEINDKDISKSGALVFGISDGKIDVRKTFEHTAEGYGDMRVAYIGDTVYLLESGPSRITTVNE